MAIAFLCYVPENGENCLGKIDESLYNKKNNYPEAKLLLCCFFVLILDSADYILT